MSGFVGWGLDRVLRLLGRRGPRIVLLSAGVELGSRRRPGVVASALASELSRLECFQLQRPDVTPILLGAAPRGNHRKPYVLPLLSALRRSVCQSRDDVR